MSKELLKMHLEGRIAKLSQKSNYGSNEAILKKLNRRLKNLEQ